MTRLNNWATHFRRNKTSDSLPIPYRPLTSERKTHLENTLRESNALLKSYHEKVNEEISRVDFFKKIYSERILDCVTVNGVNIPKDDLNKILEIKNIEWEILCGFSKLIAKLSNKWSNRDIDLSLSFDDLFSEAVKASLFAMIHFTESNISFCTFLHHCVNRQLSKICNKTNGLSHLSAGAVELKKKYLKLCAEEGSNFDSVVKKLNLNEKDVRILRHILSKVKNQSVLEENENELEQLAVDNSEEVHSDSNILQLVKEIEFSDLEKSVLDGFMNSSSGKLGLNSISRNLINPRTNKPYSRMAFTLAWKRIKEKISKAYGKVA